MNVNINSYRGKSCMLTKTQSLYWKNILYIVSSPNLRQLHPDEKQKFKINVII